MDVHTAIEPGVSYERAQGYLRRMTEPVKDLAQEAQSGRSPRTPWLALSGVTVIVGGLVAVVLAVAFLAYYLSK